MKNEWRDNVWLIIELAVVSLAIWALLTILYMRVWPLFIPRGFDPVDVYTLEVGSLGTKNPNYTKESENETKEERMANYYADYAAIVKRISENPNVESVATQSGAVPYNYNYSGLPLFRFDITDTIPYYGNRRSGSPDIVFALGINSRTGKTRQELKEMLERGELLISDNNVDYEESGLCAYDLIGKRVVMGNDSTTVYTIGDVVEKIRRNEYEDSWGGTVVVPMNQGNEQWGGLMIRMKPGRGDAFKEDFKNIPELRKQRNVYFYDLKSLMDIREANQRASDTEVRMYIVLMVFLMVTIFLGLLGTFWFRMQQRVSEIAIRKVCGATKGEIFRRIVSEGMVLLLIATLLAAACIWPFFKNIKEVIYEEWYVVLIAEAATAVLVAIGIVVSLWYPARKAMSIEPAIAIKSE